MSFNPPSKEEIKQKYRITENDFDILIQQSIPDAKDLQSEESLLEKVADYFGVPTFLKKHRKKGLVLAILFIPGWIGPVCENAKNVIVTTYNFYNENIRLLSNIIDENSKYLVFYPNSNEIPKKPFNIYNMPIASGITGISATDVPRFPQA
jgi:hypothetical protein